MWSYVICVWIFWQCLRTGECRDNYTEMSFPVDYTPYQSEMTYSSNGTSPKFDPKGMQALYFITNMFVDLVGSDLKKDIPRDLVPGEDGNIGDPYTYAKQWLSYEKGIAICAGIGIGLAILVPLIGLISCCCRCCGKCGAYPEKYDEKHQDSCQCGTLTLIFLFLCVIMTFGVICAFVTNEYMRVATRKANFTVHDSLDDINSYLRDAQKHASHVLVFNFKELEDHVRETLNDTEVTSQGMFDSGLSMAGAESLLNTADSLAQADEDIVLLNATFLRLRRLEDTLRHNITTIQGWMSDVMDACATRFGGRANGAVCDRIREAREGLQLVINFSDLSLSNGLADFERRLDGQVVQQIKNGRDKLASLRSSLKNELRRASDTVIAKLEEARTQVLDIELKIRQKANAAQLELKRVDLDSYFGYFNQYSEYVYYVKLVLCILILLILALFVLGALFGICGSRSGSLYEDPFCNKSKGSSLLMCGVGWSFFLYFVVMLAISALFLVGTNMQLLGCDTLVSSTSNNHLKVLSGVLHRYGLVDEELQDIPSKLQKCHQDMAIYDVLDLNSTFGVDNRMEGRLSDIDVLPEVKHIVDDVSRRIQETRFLSENERNVLQNLADSPAIRDFSIEPLRAKLALDNVLAGSLNGIVSGIAGVERLFDQSSPADQRRLDQDRAQLLRIGRELENLNRTLIVEIDNEKTKSLSIIDSLARLLGDSSISDRITEFVAATSRTESRFKEVAGPVIRSIANDTVENLQRHVTQYLNYSLNEVHNRVGRCSPASLAINSTVGLVCRDLLYPFNGFWLSVGWCLVLLLPCLLIAVALAWHYRVPESYRSGSSDSDFEPQTEIDTIPLAHRRKRIVHPASSDNSAYDSRARQSKATQWAFHNAFKNQPGYYPVRKGSQQLPSAPHPDDSVYTRPPSYYYPGSSS